MGGYLKQDPAVERWVRMRETGSPYFRWSPRNIRIAGGLGLVVPGIIMYYAVKYNVSRFLFASSAAVFGDEPTLPKNEKSVTKPISQYGLEKLVVE